MKDFLSYFKRMFNYSSSMKSFLTYSGDRGVLIPNPILTGLKNHKIVQAKIYDEKSGEFLEEKVRMALAGFDGTNGDLAKITKNGKSTEIVLSKKGFDFLNDENKEGIIRMDGHMIYSENFENFETLYDYFSQ